VRFTEDCSVYPTFNPKLFINESLRHGSISSNRIYEKGSSRFKCRWDTDNTIMNYDEEWSNEASLEDIIEFKLASGSRTKWQDFCVIKELDPLISLLYYLGCSESHT
jgi:hypothetical protein